MVSRAHILLPRSKLLSLAPFRFAQGSVPIPLSYINASRIVLSLASVPVCTCHRRWVCQYSVVCLICEIRQMRVHVARTTQSIPQIRSYTRSHAHSFLFITFSLDSSFALLLNCARYCTTLVIPFTSYPDNWIRCSAGHDSQCRSLVNCCVTFRLFSKFGTVSHHSSVQESSRT